MDTTAYPISSPNQDSPRTSSDSRTYRTNGAPQDEPSWRRRMHKRVGSRDNQDMEVLLLNEKVESLRRELEAERRLRNDEIKNIQRSLQRVYHDCANLASRDAEQLVDLDNKVETLSQRYRADHGELNTLRKRLDTMENLLTSLRARLEPNDYQGQSRHQQTHEHRYHDSPQQPQQEHRNSLPNRLSNPERSTHTSSINSPWTAQIIWVLSASRPNVSEVDGVAYLKLQSRSTRNKVLFTADSSLAFFLGIEGSFPHIIRRRAWMPLASHKTSENDEVARITLDKLPARMRDDRLWTRPWLEEHCVTYDSAGKPHIYIALQEEDLTLAELDGVAAATKTATSNRIDSVHAGQPPQVTSTSTPIYASNRPSTRNQTPKPMETPAITTTNATPMKTPPLSHATQHQHAHNHQPHYFQSAPTTARVSVDSPSHTSTPFTSTGLTTPTATNPPTTNTTSNPSAHPALRNKARSHSLQLSALPQYPQPHATRSGPLSPQEQALLAHNPQPGLHPILAGGTDEAASSIAASDIKRNRSLGKAERLLGRTHNVAAAAEARDTRPRPATAGNSTTNVNAGRGGMMGKRSASGGAVLQQVSSYTQQQQSNRTSRSGGEGMAIYDTPTRPASANALDAYGKAPPLLPPPPPQPLGDEGRKSPRKKKSFGRLVEKLTGRSRNSIGAAGSHAV